MFYNVFRMFYGELKLDWGQRFMDKSIQAIHLSAQKLSTFRVGVKSRLIRNIMIKMKRKLRRFILSVDS